MTTLVTPRFRHEGVLSDGNGIFGDESDLSQKLFSLIVNDEPTTCKEAMMGPNSIK